MDDNWIGFNSWFRLDVSSELFEDIEYYNTETADSKVESRKVGENEIYNIMNNELIFDEIIDEWVEWINS